MKRKFWKTRGMRIAACLLAVTTMVAVGGCSADGSSAMKSCSNSKSEVKSSYTFTYDLNYVGSQNRTISLGAGKKASNYKASRYGYELEGWFCEKECITPYNFANPVNKDTTIYALWTDLSTIVSYTVTFDYGDGVTTSEKYREGKTISAYSVMSSQKFGYDIVGWYLDEAYTQEFKLGSDPVTGEMTLYAKYEPSSGVDYTEDGDFQFENVEITLAFKDDHSTKDKKWVQTLIDEFNDSYAGQISVSVVASSEKPTLVYNQTAALNAKSNEFYPIEDVLDIVGKQFDANEYYENWINDCYIDGVLYTMPIGAFVPVIGYNRNLLNKYGGVLPTDHDSFMALLEQVQTGESVNEDWQGVISTSYSWDMTQIVSNNFYVQNNLPLYSVGENGKMANQWLDSDESKARALTSINWFRDTFVKFGSIGKVWGTAWQTGTKGVDFTWVGNGKSFMGVMGSPNLNSIFGWRTDQTEKTLWTKTVGAMPISYLFAAAGDEEASKRIYVQNYSLGIAKYSTDEVEKVAAAAVFADFASKYCEDCTESYLYPANKVAQYNAFHSLTRPWCVDYLLEYCGEPENFYTYPGAMYEYNVAVTTQSTFLLKDLYWVDDEATDEEVLAVIEKFCKKINKEMGVL